jgi:uncharacterized protein (TIGR02118 family)
VRQDEIILKKWRAGVMVKMVGIYYQPGTGEKFDEEYYKTKHMPMVKELFPEIVGATYSKSQPSPDGEKPMVVGIGATVWTDVESLWKAMSSPKIKKVMNDIPNYATCKSEVFAVIEEEV